MISALYVDNSSISEFEERFPFKYEKAKIFGSFHHALRDPNKFFKSEVRKVKSIWFWNHIFL